MKGGFESDKKKLLTYIEAIESPDVVDELGVNWDEVVETQRVAVCVALDLARRVH